MNNKYIPLLITAAIALVTGIVEGFNKIYSQPRVQPPIILVVQQPAEIARSATVAAPQIDVSHSISRSPLQASLEQAPQPLHFVNSVSLQSESDPRRDPLSSFQTAQSQPLQIAPLQPNQHGGIRLFPLKLSNLQGTPIDIWPVLRSKPQIQ